MQMIIDIYVRPDQDERLQAIDAVLRRAGYAVMPLILENQRNGQHYQQRRAIGKKAA